MLLFLLFSRALSSVSHHACEKRCEQNYAGTPKHSTCVRMCSRLNNLDPIIITNSPKQEIVNCIEDCSKDTDSPNNFIKWSKCRKRCLITKNKGGKDKQNKNYALYPARSCLGDCEKSWKGTVHFEKCNQQCELYKQHYEKNKIESEPIIQFGEIW